MGIKVESLNVGVATSIILYELNKRGWDYSYSYRISKEHMIKNHKKYFFLKMHY